MRNALTCPHCVVLKAPLLDFVGDFVRLFHAKAARDNEDTIAWHQNRSSKEESFCDRCTGLGLRLDGLPLKEVLWLDFRRLHGLFLFGILRLTSPSLVLNVGGDFDPHETSLVVLNHDGSREDIFHLEADFNCVEHLGHH